MCVCVWSAGNDILIMTKHACVKSHRHVSDVYALCVYVYVYVCMGVSVYMCECVYAYKCVCFFVNVCVWI